MALLVGFLTLFAHELIEQKRNSDRKKNHQKNSNISFSHYSSLHFLYKRGPFQAPATFIFTLTISSVRSNEDFKVVAPSGSVLLKRTHHVGEEADHHSQTHDSRRTQSLPKETRAYAGRSGKVVGDRTKCGQSLGNWQTENPSLPIRTSGLLRKGKQNLNAPYLPSIDDYIVISL